MVINVGDKVVRETKVRCVRGRCRSFIMERWMGKWHPRTPGFDIDDSSVLEVLDAIYCGSSRCYMKYEFLPDGEEKAET